MKARADNAESWSFDIRELSAGVYQVVATHPSGRRVELTGTQPDALIEQAKSAIVAMN
jgi:hypothetical protein